MIHWEDIFEYLYDCGDRLYDYNNEVLKTMYVSYLTQKTREDIKFGEAYIKKRWNKIVGTKYGIQIMAHVLGKHD